MQSQRDHGHDAAFATVVGTHDEHHVLDRDNDDQRPQDQGKDAQHICRVERDGMHPAKNFLDRIERTRANVAVNNPQSSQRQCGLL